MTIGPDLEIPAAEAIVDHNWRIQTASDGPVSEFVALALDRADRAHVAYWQEGELRYAVHDGTAWPVETAARPESAGEFLGLALDTSERPHIVFVSGAALWYTHRDEDGWQPPEMVASGAFLGRVSLRFGARTLHLGLHMNGDLLYGRLAEGGVWAIQVVAEGRATGFHHDLALDDQDRPHFVYHSGDDNSLNYTFLEGGDWQQERLGGGTRDPLSGTENSLLLDGERPQISYVSGESVVYQQRDANGEWQIEVAAAAGAPVGGTQIAFFPSGVVGIGYYRLGARNSLHFTRRLDDGWAPELVDDVGDVGDPAVMALDGLGRPQIVYLDFAAGSLKHSHWNLPPVINNLSDGSRVNVHVDGVVRGNVLANDVDPDGLPLTATLIEDVRFGTLTLAEDGAFTYRPNLGYRGPDSFTYRGCDDNGLCDTAEVAIRVFVPTLIFIREEGTPARAHGSDIPVRTDCALRLLLSDAPLNTWAGVQFESPPRSGRWEKVDGWHGTLEEPGVQSWWFGAGQFQDSQLLGSGPYRWVIYSGEGGYTKVISHSFHLPSRFGEMIILAGTIR